LLTVEKKENLAAPSSRLPGGGGRQNPQLSLSGSPDSGLGSDLPRMRSIAVADLVGRGLRRGRLVLAGSACVSRYDTGRIAFCGTGSIGTPNLSYAAQYLSEGVANRTGPE
jgi:hypothetical protein